MFKCKIYRFVAAAALLGALLAFSGCAMFDSGESSVNVLNEQASAADLETYIDSQQGKVLVAVLFNSSNPDCVAALEYLNGLADKYDASKVGFVGVSIDADTSKLRSFLADNEVGFPVLVIMAYSDLADGVPIVSLVDRDGSDYSTYEGLAEIQTMSVDLDYLLNAQ